MKISLEQEVRQGENPYHDDHQVGDDTNRSQKVHDPSFKEGSVLGRPESFFVAGPGLKDPDREQGSQGEKEDPEVEAEGRNIRDEGNPGRTGYRRVFFRKRKAGSLILSDFELKPAQLFLHGQVIHDGGSAQGG